MSFQLEAQILRANQFNSITKKKLYTCNFIKSNKKKKITELDVNPSASYPRPPSPPLSESFTYKSSTAINLNRIGINITIIFFTFSLSIVKACSYEFRFLALNLIKCKLDLHM